MSIQLSGILVDGTGGNLSNTDIILESCSNTWEIIRGVVGIYTTSNIGEYSFNCPVGNYIVITQKPGSPAAVAGKITIYSDSVNTTLNDLLQDVDSEMITPAILAEIKKYRNEAVEAKNTAVDAANTSVEARGVSVSAKNEAVEAKNTAVDAANTSVEARDVSVSARNEAVEAKNQTQQIIDDAGEQSTLVVLGSNKLPGLSLVALPESGNLSHAIPEVYVDAFGADPTGVTDSTTAILRAISRATGGVLVSNFSKTKTKFAKVIFGPGQYQANNIPVVSGVEYCGQGEFATAVFPSVAGADVFRTVGTTASNSDPEQRMAGAKIRDMTVGCGLWTTDLHTRPVGSGGIYLKSMTYCLLESLRISRLSGRGLRIEGGWDSDIVNVKITDTGSGTSVSDAVPGLYIGNAVDGSVSDPSNALRFRGLQLENNVQNFHLDHDCRHITFDSPKIETSEASVRIPSIIGGVRAVSFNSPELTWQYQDQPMIRITDDQPHFGVSFNNPRPVSSTVSMGWYFDHLSTQMPMAINDVDGFALWKLVTGRNVKIQGGEIMNCGPCIIDLTSDVYIRDFNAIVSIASAAGDGSDDAIRVNGGNVHIEGCNLYCAGIVTDGSAAIYVGASCFNPTIKNNTLRGTKNYGIRVVPGATIAENRLRDNEASSSYGGLITGYTARYSVTARNDYTGFGYGSVKAKTLTLSAGDSATLPVIAGASDIQIRTLNSGGGITAGKYFADYSSTAFNEISKINGIVIGSGVAGDGYIYLSKSGANLTIKNYSLLTTTVHLLVASAQA